MCGEKQAVARGALHSDDRPINQTCITGQRSRCSRFDTFTMIQGSRQQSWCRVLSAALFQSQDACCGMEAQVNCLVAGWTMHMLGATLHRCISVSAHHTGPPPKSCDLDQSQQRVMTCPLNTPFAIATGQRGDQRYVRPDNALPTPYHHATATCGVSSKPHHAMSITLRITPPSP